MPSEGRRLLALMAVVLAARLLAFPFNDHLYGDAVSRTEMAETWVQSPHVITSFADGAAQYGPLHLYLVGAALTLVDRNDASRLVSLLFGVLTVVPLFALTRHYFAGPAARWACLALACWGLHIQASTTGGSEALALFLMWVAFAWFARALYRPHWLPFVLSAVALNFAAATRYDAWMYIALLTVVPFVQWSDRARAARYAALFLVSCLPFPVLWMLGNYAAQGDALYPLTYIDAFHRQWAAETPAGWPTWWLRLQGIGFWPAMAIVTLSPGVAVLGTVGMVTAWRQRPATRWLVAAAVVPTLYYAVRTTLLLNFVPLGRFTVVQLSLLLPFIVEGWSHIVARSGGQVARRVAQVSAVLAVAVPLGLGLYTFRRDTPFATVLKPISPIATNPIWVRRAADLIDDTIVGPGRTVVIDEDASYYDLQVGFFARLDPTHTIRLRHGTPDQWRARITASPPDTIVVFAHGRLLAQPWVDVRDRALVIDGATWVERAPGDGSNSHVRIFDRLASAGAGALRPDLFRTSSG